MDKANAVEELLTTIINIFATKFGDKVILRGGMVLRLLDSPRLTSDLDCLFVPYKSKNDIVKMAVNALKSIENVQVEYSINSKCLRCIVRQDNLTVQVEAKVAKECKTETLSTAPLARLYNQTPRVIRVMAFDVALANKLAAWYERRIVRDLYDIYLYTQMGIKPDIEILTKRLKKPIYARNVKNKINKIPISCEDFFHFLRAEVETLSNLDITTELMGILTEQEMYGLDLRIKNTILTKLD